MNCGALLLCLYILLDSEGSIFLNVHEPSEKNLLFHEDECREKSINTVKCRGENDNFYFNWGGYTM